MSRSIEPTFRLKDVTLDNLDTISIENVSAGRSYGRRFHLKCGANESGDLVFKKIFSRIKRISKNASTEQELKKLKDILKQLKTIEKASIESYKDEGCGYKFRTWFHRLFTFGSHLEKIKALKDDISTRYDAKIQEEAEIQAILKLKEEKIQAFELVRSEPLNLLRKENPEVFKKDELITLYEIMRAFPGSFWTSTDLSYSIGLEGTIINIADINEGNILICDFKNGIVSSLWDNDANVYSRPEDGRRDSNEWEIPQKWQIPLREVFIEMKKSLCSYENGYQIIKSSLNECPEWHAEQWCQKTMPKGSLKDFTIKYKSDNNTTLPGHDAGGLRRDYFASLMEALVKETSLFETLPSSLKLPRIKRDLPSTGIPCCSDAEKALYKNLGSLLWYSFSQNGYVTGMHFSEALFRGMLSLSESEIQTPFEDLPIQTHIKMVKAILEEWRDESKCDLVTTDQCLNLLDEEKMDAYIRAGDSNAISPAVFGMNLMNFMDEDCMAVDMDKVKANPVVLKTLFEIGFFKKTDLIPQYLNGASLGSLLAPIHSIAQGMHGAAGTQWKTHISATQISSLSEKIQGVSSREEVIQSLVVSAYASSGLRTKLQWLQHWMGKDTTTDQEIRQFVKFCTGLSSLPKGKKITVTSNSSGSMPIAHTCSTTIDIRDYIDEAGKVYHDGTYEKFIDCIKEGIVTTSMDIR